MLYGRLIKFTVPLYLNSVSTLPDKTKNTQNGKFLSQLSQNESMR